ncbi:MAG: hypothetical protein HYV97_10240 [Bdellovibrio sp.]|nr:hypothetical protein [Bdellovibrio sp.]
MSSVAHKIDFHDDLSALVLTEERIFAANIPLEELCVLELPDTTSYGPLWIRDLKKVLDRFPELYDHGRLRVFGSEQAMDLWEHPSLGRRRPSLAPRIPENPLEDALILIRKSSTEYGPYQYTEVLCMVEKGEFELTDSYSIDSGKTWDRLHNIEALNRRTKLNADRLPKAVPTMAQETPLKVQFFQMKSLEVPPSNLFRGMAESGFLNAAKIAATNVLFPLPRLVFSKVSEHLAGPIGQLLDTTTKKMVAGVIAGLSVMAILTFIFVQFLRSDAPNTSEMNAIENISENSNDTGVHRTYAKRSPSSKTSRTETHRNSRPPVINTSNTSFTKSKAYQDSQQNQYRDGEDIDNGNDPQENQPYDQQEDPVEQDEIRRKLARETIAPEDASTAGPAIDTAANATQPPVDEEGRDIIQPAPPAETFIEAQE